MSASTILSRALSAIVTLLGVMVIVFVLVRVVPGDPISMMIAPGASESDINALRARYGLDLPVWQQFLVWFGQVLHGNFGTSISLKQNVMTIILERLPATLELAALALAMALVWGTFIALVSTHLQGTWAQRFIDNFNGVMLAVPDFIWGLTFVLVLGVLVPLLPISGRSDPTIDAGLYTQFYLIEGLLRLKLAFVWDVLKHMILPACTMSFPLAAVIGRVLKNTMMDVMVQDYIVLARIKGLSSLRILLQEALRNAAVPALALTGVQFTFLIGGTVITERIFSYPGIGNLAIDAVINRDLPLIQGLVLTFGVIFIAVNMAVDAMTAWLNPRLRHA
ncbi:MAG TPA: ABC transporter permease [Aestuariivirga sp.]|nr:ABC transporter permease [Alphaproteobacteria bacterium]HRX36540.1 ABC transporter permease [Aestuariivirga sp.]